MEPLHTAALNGSAHSASLSVWDLFLQADSVVKAVMIGLLLTSVWVWAIIINKTWLLYRLNKESKQFTDAFWSAASLEMLHQKLADRPREPLGAVFCSAMREWRLGAQLPAGKTNWVERVQRVVRVTIERELEQLEKSLSVLAIVGSAAPFVGLFGTVWGIMNSFTAIAASKNTSLAVVAPGIAEALFATAIGLVAAIPATVAYNRFADRIGRYAGHIEAFSDELITILMRQQPAALAA